MKTLALLLLSLLPALSQSVFPPSVPTGGATPGWTHCTITNSGANLVVSGIGCIAGSTAKPAGLTLSVPLFQLPANGHVHNFRIKSSVAFLGTTTLKAGVGTTSSPNLYMVSSTGYDLKAAVSATNISTAKTLVDGSDTTAAVNVVLLLTATVDNLSSISTGTAEVTVSWSVIP